MKKFKVTRDPNAHSFGSTEIITHEINSAADELDLYSDSEKIIHYDCLAQNYGWNVDAYMVAFELPFPRFILNNLKGKPVIGLSKENAIFAGRAGYPNRLINYASLGVNRNHWPLTEKKTMKDKFVFVSMCESNTRSGFDILVPAFCEQFKGNKGVILLIKDRNSTELFKSWVKEYANRYNVEIIHDDRDIKNYEEQVEIFKSADVSICLNRSHTFGMVLLQSMSCGLPVLAPRYSGFSDYIMDTNALAIDFDVVDVNQFDLQCLENLGMKNHLFPINEQNYPVKPFWSQPSKKDVKLKMQQIIDDSNLRYELGIMSDLTASWFTWKRTVINLSHILSQFKENN